MSDKPTDSRWSEELCAIQAAADLLVQKLHEIGVLDVETPLLPSDPASRVACLMLQDAHKHLRNRLAQHLNPDYRPLRLRMWPLQWP